jgi:uncharacterized protein YqeY
MLDKVRADIKTSLLAGDRFRAEALKLVQAALMNARIAKTSDLSSEEEIVVVQKEIKKRREAIAMYESAGSVERAESEAKEATILEEFVPKMLSGAELLSAVEEFLKDKDLATLSFPDAIQQCIAVLGNVDKGQLAVILKQKLSK